MKLKLDRKRKEWLTAYGFLLPDALGLSVFVFFPIFYSFYVSLHEWNILTPKIYIGLSNYQELFTDMEWWDSLLKTFKFSLYYVPLLFALSLFFAVVLNSLKGKVANITRTMYLMPFAITSVISAIIWMFLLNPRQGVINQFLNFFGIPNQQFLGSPTQAMWSIIVVILWINLGYNMIIFLSAIKDIPVAYYEAAYIDGANKWKSFWHITFPLLRETSIFILVVNIIGSFQVFDQINVMTNGGPANATEVSVLYIYKNAFRMLKMGYASSLAVVLFLVLFVLSIIQLRLYMKRD